MVGAVDAEKVPEVLDMLNRDGWYFFRQKCSHRHYGHPSKPGIVTVAGKPSGDIAEETYQGILKQAGLKK